MKRSDHKIDGVGVELPRAQDIYKGDLRGPNGTRCVLGWAMYLIPDTSQRMSFYTNLARTVRLQAFSPSRWNDDPATTKQEIADTFERAWCEFFDVEAR